MMRVQTCSTTRRRVNKRAPGRCLELSESWLLFNLSTPRRHVFLLVLLCSLDARDQRLRPCPSAIHRGACRVRCSAGRSYCRSVVAKGLRPSPERCTAVRKRVPVGVRRCHLAFEGSGGNLLRGSPLGCP